MPRNLRHVKAGVAYAMTHRTRDGRHAFVPTPELEAELNGVVGDAQMRWPQVQIHQMVWLSNHMTSVLSILPPYAANALARWTNYVFGESAKIAKAIHGLDGEVWETRRYRLIELGDEAALRATAKYVMAQAPAAGLVARPAHWPGLNTCDAVCRGRRLQGYRGTAKLRRRARFSGVQMASIAPAREIHVSPLPTQVDWPEHARQSWYRAIEREIVVEIAAASPRRAYPSVARLRRVDPSTTKTLVQTDPPRIHAAPDNHEARRTWRAMMRAFTAAWRAALAAWIRGAQPCFPECGWVPFGACYAPGYPLRE